MTADHLSATFAALADPTRRAILARLVAGETSVQELAAPFAISPPAVTKHLKVLERAGLISRSRHAQWRPCRLEAKPLREVADWIERYRAFWEGSLDRLEEFVHGFANEGEKAWSKEAPRPIALPSTHRGSGDRHHAAHRRAARARVQGLYGSEAGGEMVGADGLHHHHP